MDGLISPQNGASPLGKGTEAQTLLFDMGSDQDYDGEPPIVLESFDIKAYFYCEDDDLQEKMFPSAWFKAMSEHLHQAWDKQELPFHEVSVRSSSYVRGVADCEGRLQNLKTSFVST